MARVTRGGPNTPVTISAVEDGVTIPTSQSGTVTLADGTTVKVSFADDASVTAFGRARVANPQTLLANHSEYDKSRLVFFEKITDSSGNASSAFNATERLVDMTVETNDEIIRQSKLFTRYQPGKGQLVFITQIFDTSQANLLQECGWSDGSNGVVLRLDTDEALKIVRQSTAGDSNLTAGEEAISQANWNVDTFGAGALNPSGYTLDENAVQIFGLDLQALYAGRVRVGFDIDGVFYPAHQFLHANEIDKPYIATANLPARWRIKADGAITGSATLKALCVSVDSEGGSDEELGNPFSASNGTTTISVTTSRPVLSIRPKATFNSIATRGVILPESIAFYSDAQAIFWQVIYGGTLTNDNAASVDDDSIVEVDVAATAVADGIVIASGYVAAGASQGNARPSGSSQNGLLSNLPLALDIDGNHPTVANAGHSDWLTLTAESIPGTTTEVSASAQWRELR